MKNPSTSSSQISRFFDESRAHWIPVLLITLLAMTTAEGWVRGEFKRIADRIPRSTRSSDLQFELNPDLLRFASFGQVGVMIDSLWITMLQDTSLTHVRRGEHPPAYYLLDAISQLDPAYYEAYVHGARMISVVRDDGEGAQHLVMRGEKFIFEKLASMPARFRDTYWPNPWDVHLLRAYIELFDLRQFPSAAEAFERAAAYPGAPAHFASLASRIRDEEKRYPLAEKVIQGQLDIAKDDEVVRHELEKKAQAVQISKFLFHAGRAFREARLRQPLTWERFLKQQPQWRLDPLGGEVRPLPGPDSKLTTTTSFEDPFPDQNPS